MPTSEFSQQDAVRVLTAVCSGDVTATPAGSTAAKVFCGDVEFELSNGWAVRVAAGYER